MRLSFIILGLLALGACAPHPEAAASDPNADTRKFIEPVNGAAYSQSDVRYYQGTVSGAVSRGR